MRILTLSFVLLFMAAALTSGWATPSTLIWIPSTDIQEQGTWHLGIDDYFPASEGAAAPTDVGLTYGGGQWEAGVDYFGGTAAPLSFNAKVLLTDEAAAGADLALGIYAAGTNSSTAYNIAYALFGKTFRGTRLTAGYFKGRDSLLGGEDTGLLLGVDRTLNDKWWVAADYQEGESEFGATSLGAAYTFAPNASIILGFVRFNDRSLQDMITTQVDVNF